MDTRRDIDLHCLDLRYADARLVDARAVERLARSIEQCGQRVPCIVVPDADRLVVIDGYRRIAALRRLGRDTANVQQWICDLAQGLLNVLAQSKSRPFMAIEEALLLRERVNRLQLSQREVARRTGRDVSWVQRRLQLVVSMSDPLLDAVRSGGLFVGRQPHPCPVGARQHRARPAVAHCSAGQSTVHPGTEALV